MLEIDICTSKSENVDGRWAMLYVYTASLFFESF